MSLAGIENQREHLPSDFSLGETATVVSPALASFDVKPGRILSSPPLSDSEDSDSEPELDSTSDLGHDEEDCNAEDLALNSALTVNPTGPEPFGGMKISFAFESLPPPGGREFFSESVSEGENE